MRDRLRINNRIRAREVRLIDEDNNQVGIVQIRDALTMAEERGLDLVEVAPNAVPPVCRLMDHGKYRYEQTKKEREARKNQKQVEIKQIRLEPKTDTHDIDVKTSQARRFLIEGDKVKFNLRFRGREIFHQEIGREILERIAENLRDIAIIEQRPLMEGKVLSLTLAPGAKAKAQQEKRERAPREPVERPQQAAPAVESATSDVEIPQQAAPAAEPAGSNVEISQQDAPAAELVRVHAERPQQAAPAAEPASSNQETEV
ncbi:MAG: translation initiation factor IF-3 [Roseiflexaceae bacterium]|nr:translation initiation factor IF-3 [Roseiflexaceae bacterium]